MPFAYIGVLQLNIDFAAGLSSDALDLVIIPNSFGTATALRMLMITITTISSIRVIKNK